MRIQKKRGFSLRGKNLLTLTAVFALVAQTIYIPTHNESASAATNTTYETRNFTSLDWTTSRSEPSLSKSVIAESLTIGVNATKDSNPFNPEAYNRFEGLQANLQPGISSIKSNIHVDENWNGIQNLSVEMWASVTTQYWGGQYSPLYPAIIVSNDEGGINPHVYAWNPATGSTSNKFPVQYGQNLTLELESNPLSGKFIYSLNDTVIYEFGGPEWDFGDIASIYFHSINPKGSENNNYSATWTNLNLGKKIVKPAVSSISPGAGNSISGENQRVDINISNPETMRGGFLQLKKAIPTGDVDADKLKNHPILQDANGWYATVDTSQLIDGEKYLYKVEAHGVQSSRGYLGNNSAWQYPNHHFVVDNSSPVITDLVVKDLKVGNLTSGDVRVEFTMADASAINFSQNLTHVRFINGKDSLGNSVSSGTFPVQRIEDTDRYFAIVKTKNFVPEGTVANNFRVYVRAEDKVNRGNQGAASFYKNQTITIDNKAPQISVVDGYIGDKEAKRFKSVNFKLHDSHKVTGYSVNHGSVTAFIHATWSDANFQNIKSRLLEGEANTITLYDLAGNQSEYSFIYDTTAPIGSISFSHLNKNTNAKEITATLTTNEAVRKIDGWNQVGEHSFQKTFENNGWISVDITDLAGNSNTIKAEIKAIDRLNPEISGIVSGTSTNKPVTLSVFDPKTDVYADGFDALHGLKIKRTDIENAPEHSLRTKMKKGKIYESDEITEEGSYTATAKDKAGNTSEPISFNIDYTEPTGKFLYSHNNKNTNVDEVTVTLELSEAIQDISDVSWTKGSNSNTYTKTFKNNGKFSVNIADLAGNTSTVSGEVKAIDRANPIITGVEEGEYTSSSVTLSVYDPKVDGNSDGFDALHGLKIQRTDIEDAIEYGLSTVEADGKIYVSDPIVEEGSYRATATDKAGNETTVEFTIDKSSPIVELIEALNEDGSVDIVASIQDDNLSHYYLKVWRNGEEYRIPGTAWTTKKSLEFSDVTVATLTEEGQYEIKLEAADLAGNKDGNKNEDGLSVKTIKISVTPTEVVEKPEEIVTPPGEGGVTNTPLTPIIPSPLTARPTIAENVSVEEDDDNSVSVNSALADTFNAGIVGLTDPFFANILNNPNNTANDAEVLGAQTEREDRTPSTSGTILDASSTDEKGVVSLFGLAWYWWIALLALATALWATLTGLRNRNENTTI